MKERFPNPELFANICRLAVEIGKVDHSGFVLFSDDQTQGEVVADFPIFGDLCGTCFDLTTSPVGQSVLGHDEPFVVDDVARDVKKLGDVGVILTKYDISSLCIVKVYAGQRAIGSFSFDWVGSPREFDAEKIEQCKLFGDLASMIVSHQNEASWREAFIGSSLKIISEQRFDEMLSLLVEQAKLLFNSQEAGFYVREQKQIKTVTKAGTRMRREDILFLQKSSYLGHCEMILRKKDKSLAWRVVQTDIPYMATPRYARHPDRSPMLPDTGWDPNSSLLVVPMVWQKERIGALYVVSEPDREFTESDADILKRLADIFTIAYQHQLLLDRFKKLSEATINFSSKLDLDSLNERLSGMAAAAAELLNAETCSIFRWTDENVLSFGASYGYKRDHRGGRKILDKRRSGLTGAIAARLLQQYQDQPPDAKTHRYSINYHGKTLRTDRAVAGKLPDETPSRTCHSLLAVPLIGKSDSSAPFLGVLYIRNKKGVNGKPSDEIVFSENDTWLLHIFAEAAAVALESAELVRKLEEKQELSRRLLDLETQRHLGKGRTLGPVLSDLVSYLVSAVDVTFCHIFTFDRGQISLVGKAAANHPRNKKQLNNSHIINQRLPIGDWDGFYDLLQKGKPYEIIWKRSKRSQAVLRKLTRQLDLKTTAGKPQSIRSLYLYPLHTGGRLVGLLSLGDVRKPDAIKGRGKVPADKSELAQLVAGPLSAVLYREFRSLAEETERVLRKRLTRVITRMRRATSSDQFVERLPSEIQYVHGASVTAVELNIVNTGTIVFRSSDPENYKNETSPQEPEKTPLDYSDKKLGSKRAVDLLARHVNDRIVVPRAGMGVKFEFANGSRGTLLFGLESEEIKFQWIHERVLDTLSQHCAITLTKLIASERQRNATAAVEKIAETLAINTPLSLDNVVRGIKDAMNCEAVTIYPIKENQKVPDAAPAVIGLDDNDAVIKGHKYREDSPPGRILKLEGVDPHIVRTREIDSDPLIRGAFVEREKIKAVIAMRILSTDTRHPDGPESRGEQRKDVVPVGVLFVNYKKPRYGFSPEEINTFKLCKHLAAIGLRNAQIHLREIDERKNLERRLAGRDILRDIAKRFGSVTDSARYAQDIATAAFELGEAYGSDMNFVTVALKQDNSYLVVSTHPRSLMDQLTEQFGNPIAMPNADGLYIGVVARALKEATEGRDGAVNIDKIEDVKDTFLEVRGDGIGKTTSEAVVPILSSEDNTVLGSINFESKKPGGFAFSAEALASFQLLATLSFDRLSIIENYLILEKARIDLAEARITEDALKEAWRYHVRRGLGFHNIKGRIETLLSTLQGLATSGSTFAELPRIWDELEDLNSVDSDATTVDLQVEMGAFVKRLRERYGNSVDVISAIPPSVRLLFTQKFLSEVLLVFVKNSEKARVPSRKLKIKFIYKPDGSDFWRIEIADNGSGVDQNKVAGLFRQSFKKAGATSAGGSGIGLLTVRFLVEDFGGRAELLRTGPEGTTFAVSLRVAK